MKKWLALLAIMLLATYIYVFRDDDIKARRFCAYGQAYIEFQQGPRVWGTTFLDEHGHPLKCEEDDARLQTSSSKEII